MALAVLFQVFVTLNVAQAQETRATKRILALYWYGKDFPTNVSFDQNLKSVFQNEAGVEYYAEYLESNRFPGEAQSAVLRDYLRQKYSDRKIDVVITLSSLALDFMLKHREDLFPEAGIVFHTFSHPELGGHAGDPRITGVVTDNVFGKTLDLALRLHPTRKRVLIIVRTSERDQTFEAEIREDLKAFEDRTTVTYLTNLPLDKLLAEVRNADNQSIILYVRYSEDEVGRSIDPFEALSLVVQSAKVPIYSLGSQPLLGRGSIGGYSVSMETVATRVAQISVSIANGKSPQEIPVEVVASTATFDARQLKQWGIREDQLPPGHMILFAELTTWQRYKWRILGVAAVLLLQTLLIAGLLFERARRWRATRRLSESEERYRNVVQTQSELICRYLPDTTLTFVNDAYCRYFDKSRDELIGTKFLELIPERDRQSALSHVHSLIENPRIEIHEHQAVLADGMITWQQWVNHVITNGDGHVKELQGIGRDITERKLAEEELQVSEQRFAKAFSANPQPMSLTTLADGRYIDVNESFLQMSGFTRDEVVGHTSLELRNFENSEDRERLVGPLRTNGSVRNLELKFRKKDGEFRTLLSSAELLHLGGQQCVLVASSDITDRKRLEEERLQAKNELSQLTARLFSLQDEERRRIARELHDGTAQNLFAISLDIDQIRKQTNDADPELRYLLDESTALCDQSLQEIRTLSYLLHPPLLDQAGLVPALRWYVEGFTKRTGVAVNVVAPERVGRMTSEIETALFRIVQEGLTNVRRHSHSETASIRLWRERNEMILEIQDNGRGIDGSERFGLTPEMNELGVGIPGMRQRVHQLGGRLDITSGSSGTVVTAVIPIKEPPATF